MPKKVFWPATLVVMGLIFMAAILDLLPSEFMSFWPLLLIIVGLGGLLTSDRDEWMSDENSKKSKSPSAKKTAKKSAPAAKTSKAKKAPAKKFSKKTASKSKNRK